MLILFWHKTCHVSSSHWTQHGLHRATFKAAKDESLGVISITFLGKCSSFSTDGVLWCCHLSLLQIQCFNVHGRRGLILNCLAYPLCSPRLCNCSATEDVLLPAFEHPNLYGSTEMWKLREEPFALQNMLQKNTVSSVSSRFVNDKISPWYHRDITCAPAWDFRFAPCNDSSRWSDGRKGLLRDYHLLLSGPILFMLLKVEQNVYMWKKCGKKDQRWMLNGRLQLCQICSICTSFSRHMHVLL